MTIIHDIPLRLETEQVFRREGIRQYGTVKPEIKALIDEIMASIQSEHLLKPAIAYEIYPITNLDRHELRLAGNITLHSPLLTSILSKAEELAVAVCTIGPEVEKKVTDYLGKGEALRGLLLDGIGNAAVDSLAQEACKLITDVALLRGYQASNRFSPGMTGFPITEQQWLFQLIPTVQIGVKLTPSDVMVPLKSTSMVIGMGKRVPKWTQHEVCAHCNLSRTCLYRLESGEIKKS